MPTSSCRAAEGCRRRLLSSSCTPSLRRLSSSCRAAEACSPEYVTHVPDLANTTQDVPCDVLYVVGGLYGNVAALEALEAGVRCEAEAGLRVEVCFNGDFNFFNATTETWARVNDGVRRLGRATAGNVERETLNSESTGCGCAYPEYVDAQFADRAAIIVDELRHVNSDPDIATWLAALPLYRTYVVRGTRVVCVHGDPACANGWALAAEHLPGGSRPEYATDDALVEGWFETANADVFACAHTCRPVLKSFRNGLVANNGSAGLGNFRDDARGLVTRVAPSNVPSALGEGLYGADLGGVRVEAVALAFDVDAALGAFDEVWAPGSAAAVSYRERLVQGDQNWSPRDADRV